MKILDLFFNLTIITLNIPQSEIVMNLKYVTLKSFLRGWALFWNNNILVSQPREQNVVDLPVGALMAISKRF